MSIRDCITSAVADGHISEDVGAEYIERWTRGQLGAGTAPDAYCLARARA